MTSFHFSRFRKNSGGGFRATAEKFNSIGVGAAIRRGLSIAMPIMALGAIARFVNWLPIPSYQQYIATNFGSVWETLFAIIEETTFAIISPIICMGVSYTLALNDRLDRARVINPIVAAAVSVACMSALLSTDITAPLSERFGIKGVFVAIVVAITATRVFSALSHSRFVISRIFGSPKDRDLTGVVGSIIPAIITFGLFVIITLAIVSLDIPNFMECLEAVAKLYSESNPNSLVFAVLTAFIFHIAMFFGIYDPSALSIIATPSLAISSSGILTEEFFEQFVFIGGSGSTFALLVATLISARRDSLRSVAILGTVPSLVNSNEMIVFGAPVAFNSYLFIPFVASPVALTAISYTAISLGFVPKATTFAESSTPILAGGYIATGHNLAGAALQLFGVAVTTLIYLPFIKTYDRVLASDSARSLKRLIARVENFAEQSANRLISAHGADGNLARSIASDLGLALREGFETFGVTMEKMRLNAVLKGREDSSDDPGDHNYPDDEQGGDHDYHDGDHNYPDGDQGDGHDYHGDEQGGDRGGDRIVSLNDSDRNDVSAADQVGLANQYNGSLRRDSKNNRNERAARTAPTVKKRCAIESFLSSRTSLASLGELRRMPPLPGVKKAKRRIGELMLMYQPLMTQESSIIGIEALLRWNHPEFGYLPPQLIVEIAEESGYGEDLGRFVFMSAFSTLRDLIKQGMDDVVMSVNITPAQLDNDSFAADVSDIANNFGVPAHKIEFEITERVALGGERRVNMLKKLHSRGFRLAMDDFGMGHGSLMYLKQFDLTSLKLDGALSREIENNQACREIVSSIVRLAKTMDINVVAEYVETVRQREILRDLGCMQFQGYLYSAALEANGLIKYCRKHIREMVE